MVKPDVPERVILTGLCFDNLFVKETKGSQPEVPGHVFLPFLLPCCIKESVDFEKLWEKRNNW